LAFKLSAHSYTLTYSDKVKVKVTVTARGYSKIFEELRDKELNPFQASRRVVVRILMGLGS